MSLPQSKITDATSTQHIEFLERVTCTVAQACEATGLGRAKLYALIAEGFLETTKVGTRRLIDVGSLKRLLQPRR
jgi:excisionase family DNA binding protein